ncbi:MAG: MFS transporter [Curvibacter lanceolatus]|jgi:predicted MFS family arabinose efflux permease|uniref:MFS transporter n=1 Tax=Curvibacter lanceolatus TaxID=86182 RepID=UPI0003749F3B|nr:MFS transporter [Curvibacter lanceolatus]MBV5295691.1 MFS transporter [Curvibacter lanceolatus]
MNSLSLTLRLLGLAAFGSMASMRVCDPMLGALGHDFNVSTGEASRVIASFAVAYGVLQLFYGPLGDRLGKIRVINLATAGCAVFSALTALAPSLDVLVLSRAAMGGAAAGIIPLSMAWIGDQVGYEQRQATLGRFMGATVTGMMAGQWFGGVASEYLGWRMAFGLLSVLFALAAFTLYRKTGAQRAAHAQALTQTPPVPWQRSFHATFALLRLPRVRWVVSVTAIEGALAFGTLAFVPSRLVSTLGFSPSAAGGVMMLYGVGGLLYSQFVTRWLRLLGERGLALLGGALIAVSLWALAFVPVAAVAVSACFLAGLGFYMLHNTLQTQATQMAPHARGSAVTLFACLLFLGQSLGVLVVGSTVDQGGLAPAMALAGLGVLVLAWAVSRRVAGRIVVPAG